LIDLRKPVRASPGRGRRVGLVVGLLALTLVAVTASLAIGTKAITPDAVWARCGTRRAARTTSS
jgi:hypothetical protein